MVHVSVTFVRFLICFCISHVRCRVLHLHNTWIVSVCSQQKRSASRAHFHVPVQPHTCAGTQLVLVLVLWTKQTLPQIHLPSPEVKPVLSFFIYWLRFIKEICISHHSSHPGPLLSFSFSSSLTGSEAVTCHTPLVICHHTGSICWRLVMWESSGVCSKAASLWLILRLTGANVFYLHMFLSINVLNAFYLFHRKHKSALGQTTSIFYSLLTRSSTSPLSVFEFLDKVTSGPASSVLSY